MNWHQCSSCNCLLRLDWYPYLEASHSGRGIKVFAIALEIRSIGHFVHRFRQPLIPNAVPRTANGGDMAVLGKHCISLFRNSYTGPIGGKPGEIHHFHAAHVVKVAHIVTVAANTVSCSAKLTGDVA